MRRPRTSVRQVLMQAAAINPNWTTVEHVVENVRHSPALREILAGALSPRHPSQLYEAALEGILLFAILWILRTHFRLPNGILTGAYLYRLRNSSHDRLSSSANQMPL